MIWQLDLEYQSLIIKIVPAVIGILECAPVHEPVLSNKVIIAQAEHEPLVIIPKQTIYGNDANTLPFLIQQS